MLLISRTTKIAFITNIDLGLSHLNYKNGFY